MFTVTVLASWGEKTHRYTHSVRLHEALSDMGLSLFLPCGGHGTCGKCIVRVQGAVSAPSPEEKQQLSAFELSQGYRLACQTEATGDCMVYYTTSQAALQGVSFGHMQKIRLDPIGAPSARCGMAVDIGTTTVAAALFDLTNGQCISALCRQNPQAAYGLDVISRIDAALQGKISVMQRAIAATISDMAEQLLSSARPADVQGGAADSTAQRGSMSCPAHAGRSDSVASQTQQKAGAHEPPDITCTLPIDVCVITGNTTMLYLLCGYEPHDLAAAPFNAQHLFGTWKGGTYLMPCISAFVGADITAAIVSSGLTDHGAALLCDIGTNGEIALWDGSDLYCCATAAGPAFEGAKISMGGIACEGAIDHVYTGPDNTISYTTVGGKAATHICGSGLIDAVAAMLSLGVIDETGYLADRYQIGTSGVFIEPQDIREVQLAKSAIRSGMDTLLCERSCSYDSLSHLYLAGGFGQYLAPQRAAAIGLIAPQLAQKCVPTGNSALAGAAMVLLDKGCQARCEAIARQAHICHLHNNTHFSRLFMENMLF